MRKNIGIICMLFVAVILTAGPASAVPAIAFSPSSLSLSAGSSADVTVILTEAPSGLAGYNLTIVTSPSIVTVTDAAFPPWAALNQKAPVTNGYTISAIDLNKGVQAGATNVVLATVKMRGVGPGTASVGISGIDMSADGGDLMSPSPGTLQVTVSGEGSTTGETTTSATASTTETTTTTTTMTAVTTVPTTAATITTTTPGTTAPAVSETATGVTQTTATTTPTQSAAGIIPPLAAVLAMVVISALFLAKRRR